MQADAGLSSRRVLLLAPLAGVLVTLSLAPFDIWPAGILSCALYSYLLCTCTTRQALWRGWLFGLGMFGTGVSWVYVSIHVHGNASMPLAVALTAGFCAGLALLHALFAWCYVKGVRGLPGGMLVGFPALWVLFEWLRDWLLTGFPWLYLGYAHLETWISGWAPVTGVFGLSFIVALTGSCLFLAWRSRRMTANIIYFVVIVILWGGGAMLKPTQWVARASEEPLRVAIVQPNVPQEHKWDRRYYRDILRQLQEATDPQLDRDVVIWPESAVPNYFQRAQDFLGPIAERAEATNTTVITGVPFRPGAGDRYYNSIAALGYGEGVYHKQRLVPFGEYVPLEEVLRGLIEFFDLPMSAFSAGPDGQKPLRAGAFRVAPFICYEIVYGNLVARNARDTDIIVTISNDTWFGNSIGPLQHLQIARMRGRETGRYVLRGTNNGVSAIIDHQGRIVAQTERFVQTTLTGEARVMLGETPFGSFGTLPIIVACATVLVLMVLMYVGFWRDLD
ncbi:MAG: apolipoprotein N-acyltransferase [Halioglobus sp.]|nr:apolipoprotein N-acyltransferase [Halioglobus sp.]